MTDFTMKLTLTVELIGSRKVKMTIKHIDDMAIASKNSFEKMFRDKSSNIYVWSYDDFFFDERQIRLPDRQNKLEDATYTYKFPNEKLRYETLKKYFKTLDSWSKDKEIFSNQKNTNGNNVTLYEEWWFVR